MATITVTVQSLLNTALYDSYVVATTDTIGTLKANIESNTNVNVAWYTLYSGPTALSNTSATFEDYSITANSTLTSANKIARLTTLEDRQRAKLALAELDRINRSNPRFTLNIAELPTQYSGNTVVDNPNPGGLVVGRPWVAVDPTPPAVVVTDGLILNLDAGNSSSYSGTGTTWTDLSASGKNAQLGAAVYYSVADSGSLIFTNGTNGKATITSASALTGLTNNFTVEVWYNNHGPGYTPRFLNTGAGSDGFCFGAWSTNPTKFKVTKYGVVDLYLGSVPQDTNVWHQVVLVYSSTTGTRVYVDGVLSEADTSANGTTPLQGSGTPTINIGYVESLYNKGLISTIRWYNRVLSDSEIQGNYTATATRYTVNPVRSNLKVYYDASIRSNSAQSAGLALQSLTENALQITLTNATWTDPYVTFNGTSTTGSATDNAIWEPTAGSFSTEIWVYYSAVGVSQCIIGKTDGPLAADWGWGIRTNSSNDTYFEVGNGTTTATSNSYTVSAGQWYQLVGVWTRTADVKTIDLYVNGAKVGTTKTHTLTSVKNTTHSLYFGSFDGGATYGQWFNGRLGIFRHYGKALSDAEVLQNFNNDRGIYGL